MSNDGWGKPSGWGTNWPKPEDTQTTIPANVPAEYTIVSGASEEIKSVTGGGWHVGELAADGEEIELKLPSYDNETNELLEDTFITALVIKVGMIGIVVNREISIRLVHIPTLANFDSALPEREPGTRFSRKMLIEWCKTVQAEGPKEAWAAVNALTHETYNSDAKEAKAGLREYCRSVSVGKE